MENIVLCPPKCIYRLSNSAAFAYMPSFMMWVYSPERYLFGKVTLHAISLTVLVLPPIFRQPVPWPQYFYKLIISLNISPIKIF